MSARKSVFAGIFLAATALAAAQAGPQGPQGPHGGPPSGPPQPAPRQEVNFPPPPNPMTQEYVAQKFIYSLLAGQVDTLRPLFEADVQPYVTEELVERLRSQFSWLYGIIGGEFEPFYANGGDSSWFREYRLANESNDRAPLIAVQVVFRDSLQTKLIGAQVKNFLGGNEKRLAGEQTWKIKGKDFDIHSLILAQLDSGSVMAIQFYDESTDTLSQAMVSRIGVPLIKEAFARGYADSARAQLGEARLLDRVGVVFIRKDPREGLIHGRIGFAPEDFGGWPDATKPKKPKAATAKKKTPARK